MLSQKRFLKTSGHDLQVHGSSLFPSNICPPPPPPALQRMVAVASRNLRLGHSSSASPTTLSFWRHSRGSDPFGSGGYTGSYTGARSTRGGIGGGGTSGHWAADTSVDNPHGPDNAVRGLATRAKKTGGVQYRVVVCGAFFGGGSELFSSGTSDVYP